MPVGLFFSLFWGGGGGADPTAPLALLACGFNCTSDALGGDMILSNDGELSVLDCG